MSEGDGKKGRVCHVGMGSSIHVQRWVNFFAERGWDVDLITFEPAKKEDLNHMVKQHVVNPGSIPLLGFLKALFGVRKLVKQIKPDLIHAHGVPGYGIYVGLHSKLGGKEPIVVSAWGFSHLRYQKGIKRRLNRLCLRRAKIITLTSVDLKTALVESLNIDKRKFRVFSWGIDTKIFHKGYENEVVDLRREFDIAQGSQIVISPRSMSPYYRIENIIRTIPEVLKIHPRTIFVILKGFGDDAYEREIITLAQNLGVDKNVKFVSRILKPEEMVILYNLSDIMISISKTDQLSSVILEGMMCGCIPILSDLEIYKTHIEPGENGFFINGDDVSELAERIIYCLNHPELKKNFASINESIIREKEDWYKNAIKMEEVYETLLGKG